MSIRHAHAFHNFRIAGRFTFDPAARRYCYRL
jgi:hypothetical protein